MSNSVIGLCLALLIDGSGSIPKEDIFPMMVEAHANVLETEMVARQIETDGLAISVIIIEDTPRNHINWRILRNGRDLRNAIREIRNIQQAPFAYTAIGDSVNLAITTLESSNIQCERTIIDASTDGVNTAGRASPEQARDRAQELGITINAVTVDTDPDDPTKASEAARRSIITNNGFVLSATNWNDWFVAIRRKMIIEIGGIY